MYYSEAKSLLETAKNKLNGKPIANNTRLYERGDSIAVRLHNTDVVTIHPNNTWTLRSGGWRSVTTKERINRFSPARVCSVDGEWKVLGSILGHTESNKKKCRDCRGTGNQRLDRGWATIHCVSSDGLCHMRRERWYNKFLPSDFPEEIFDPIINDLHEQVKELILTIEPERWYRCSGHGISWKEWVETSFCFGCDGTGIKEYGNKPIYANFEDGITVDMDGKVI